MSGNGTSKQDRQQLAIRREGVVSSKATGGKGGATPGDDGPGVNRIKALLARQREATSQAMQSADKPRRELDGGQGELSTEQTYVDTQLPDLYDLKQKFKNTENELELERRNHQSDLEQAASRIANLESTLSIAQSAAIPRKAAA